MKKNNRKHLALSLVTILILIGCGDTPTLKTSGQFIDAPVANISYTCNDGKKDKTDENGTFSCVSFPVEFSVGNIKLGSIANITADSKVYPQDIAGVGRDDFSDDYAVKIAYLLQAFDTDGDISKTIEIDESIVVSDSKDLKTLAFSEIDSIITTSGKTPLDIEDVKTHMIDNADDEVDATAAKNIQAVNIDADALSFGDLSNVTSDLKFPSSGENGTTISYVISSGTAINSSGEVTRPSFTDKDQSVTIVATITKGDARETRAYTATVIALPINDLESITLAKKALTIAGTLSAVDGNLELVTTGLHGVTVSWETSNGAISSDGIVTRPSFSEGNVAITLTATLTKGSETRTKSFNLMVLKLPISDVESVANVKANLTLTSLDALRENLTLPTSIDGVTLTWNSSDESAISNTGMIFPNNYEGADKSAILTVVLTKGTVSDSKRFTLTIPKAFMTDTEAVDLALDSISLPTTNFSTGNNPNYTYKLDLPTNLDNDVHAVWNTSDANHITTAGDIVKAPLSSYGRLVVDLNVTVTKNSISKTKTFPIGVYIDPTDEEAVDFEMKHFNLTEEEYESITDPEKFDMPVATSYLGVDVAYSSSDESIFLPDGNGDKPTINRQSFTDGDKDVTLTATFTLNDITKSKEFNLIVKSLALSDSEAVANGIQSLSLGDTTALTENLILPSNINGVSIVWTTTDGTVISSSGVISPDNYTGVDKTATLTATLTSGAVTTTKNFMITVLKLPLTDLERVTFDKNALDLGNTSNLTSSLTLPTSGSQGSTISWSSSDATVVSNTGVVTQPTYTIGSKTITLTATITKGSVSETKSFSVTVLALDMSDAEAVTLAKTTLDLDDTSNVTSNLTLATTLANGVIVSWTSTDATTVSTTGIVTQPTYTMGNKTVTLTATLSKGSANEIKEFTVVVSALAMSDTEAVNLAKEDLSLGDTTSVTENLTLPTTGLHGTSIIYSSSNLSVVSDSGVVNRPASGNGDVPVVLTATISKNSVSDTKSFTIIVIEKEAELPNF